MTSPWIPPVCPTAQRMHMNSARVVFEMHYDHPQRATASSLELG